MKNLKNRYFKIALIWTFFVLSIPSGTTADFVISQALDSEELVWAASDPNWVVSTSETHDGRHAARSTQTRGEASIAVEVFGPGKLTFWWRARSSSGFGWIYTEFYVDGSKKASLPVSDTPWQKYQYDVPEGYHWLRWRAFKPFSSGLNADYSILDEVKFLPTTPPSPPVFTLLPPEAETGHFRFQLRRPAGRICVIDTSADLKVWNKLIVLSDHASVVTFTDQDSRSGTNRFYRAHSP